MSDSTTFKSITTESSHPNIENINDEKSLIQQISEPDEKPCIFREEFSSSSEDENGSQNIYDSDSEVK